MTPPKLRRRAPFFCRAKNPDGSFVHIDKPLAQTDGKICAACAAAAAAAFERFMNAPVLHVTPPSEEDDPPRKPRDPLWPL